MLKILKYLFFLGVGALAAFTVITLFSKETSDGMTTTAQASVIRQSLKMINKLVVVEGNYEEVYKEEKVKQLLFGLYPDKKRALIKATARAEVGYNLEYLQYELDTFNKLIIITAIPARELTLDVEVEYIDMDDGLTNTFSPADYTRLQHEARKRMRVRIENSQLPAQADIRFIQALEDIQLLAKPLGWKVINATNRSIPGWQPDV